jgi:hypothetical protein
MFAPNCGDSASWCGTEDVQWGVLPGQVIWEGVRGPLRRGLVPTSRLGEGNGQGLPSRQRTPNHAERGPRAPRVPVWEVSPVAPHSAPASGNLGRSIALTDLCRPAIPELRRGKRPQGLRYDGRHSKRAEPEKLRLINGQPGTLAENSRTSVLTARSCSVGRQRSLTFAALIRGARVRKGYSNELKSCGHGIRFSDAWFSLSVISAPSETVKKSPVNGLGRRHRRPHLCKRRSCFGGAGGAACAWSFYISDCMRL